MKQRTGRPRGRPQRVAPEARSKALEHYYATREAKRVQRLASCRRYYQAKMQKLYTYLLTHPCVDCSEADPVVLQFDHQGEKTADVAVLIRSRPWEVVLAEIQKCEVRCANCHLKRHAAEHGFYNYVCQVRNKESTPASIGS